MRGISRVWGAVRAVRARRRLPEAPPALLLPLVTLAFVLGALLACTSHAEATNTVIKVAIHDNVFVPEFSAFVSQLSMFGAMVAVREAQEDPFMLQNSTLEVKFYNSNSDMDTARNAISMLDVDMPDVAGIVGPSLSRPVGLLMDRLIHDNGIPQVSPLATSSSHPQDSMFIRLAPSEHQYLDVAVKLASEVLGYKSAAVIFEDDMLFPGSMEHISQALARHNVTAHTAVGVQVERYPAIAMSQIWRVVETNVRVFLVFLGMEAVSRFFDIVQSLGYLTDEFVWILASPGMLLSPQYPHVLGPEIPSENVPFPAHTADVVASMPPDPTMYPIVTQVPGLLASIASNGNGVVSKGYAAMTVLLQAINRTVSSGWSPTNHSSVRDELLRTRYVTHAGRLLRFDENGDSITGMHLMCTTLGSDGLFHTRNFADVSASGVITPALMEACGNLSLTNPPPGFAPDTCDSVALKRLLSGKCVPCPLHMLNPRDDGAEECAYCALGTQLVGQACLKCPKGTTPAVLDSGEGACIVDESPSSVSWTTVVLIVVATVVVLGIAFGVVHTRQRIQHHRDRVANLELSAQQQADFHSLLFHELRNPTSAASAYMSFARKAVHDLRVSIVGHDASAICPAGTPVVEQLTQIEQDLDISNKSMRHSLDVLCSMLDIAKLSRDALALEYLPVNLHQLCQDVVDMAEGHTPLESMKGVAIRMELVCGSINVPGCCAGTRNSLSRRSPCCPLWFLGDRARLIQVLLNLLTNALKFTREGEVVLNVSVLPAAHRNGPGSEQQSTDVCSDSDSLRDIEMGTIDDLDHDEDDNGDRPESRPGAGKVTRAGSGSKSVRIRFAVRDTGRGLSKSEQSSIFQLFASSHTQANDPPTAKSIHHTNIGIGLYLSMKLVKLMRSQLEVQSPWRDESKDTDTAGTEFAFAVETELMSAYSYQHEPNNRNVITEEDVDFEELGDQVDRGRLEAEDEPCPLPKGVRVLVTDDAAINRKIIRRRLTTVEPFASLGWEVEEAETGEAAIEIICNPDNEHHFDCLIIDQIMVEANGELLGHEAVQRIRAWEEQQCAVEPRPMMAIFICSGNVQSNVAADRLFFNSGCDGAWAKPLPSTADMAEDLGRCIQAHRSSMCEHE